MNPFINRLLEGAHQQLMGAYHSTGASSSASSGAEREAFIGHFLSRTLPSQFRFGTGDAIDTYGNRSGQLDIVIENSLLPSLPLVAAGNARLYLAEGICACIEVKSNLAGQWNEVLGTAERLRNIARQRAGSIGNTGGFHTYQSGQSVVMVGASADEVRIENGEVRINGRRQFPERVPFFAVGYRGWRQESSMLEKISSGLVDGVLSLEDPIRLVTSDDFQGIRAFGTAALWAFVCCINSAATELAALSFDPLEYAKAGRSF